MKKGIKKQMCENMEQSWATNTEVQQEWSREEEWADPEREKRVRKGECEGGRKVLLKRLVTAETAPTPLPSSKANWLSSLTPHAQALALYPPPPHTHNTQKWSVEKRTNKYHKKTLTCDFTGDYNSGKIK